MSRSSYLNSTYTPFSEVFVLKCDTYYESATSGWFIWELTFLFVFLEGKISSFLSQENKRMWAENYEIMKSTQPEWKQVNTQSQPSYRAVSRLAYCAPLLWLCIIGVDSIVSKGIDLSECLPKEQTV